MELFAIIGIGFLLWYVARQLKRAGAWMTDRSIEMAEYLENKRIEQNKTGRPIIKATDSLQNRKGDSDANEQWFGGKIDAAISQLEKETNAKH